MPHTPYMIHLHFTNPTNTVTSHLVYTLLMHLYSILWWILYSIECANIPCLASHLTSCPLCVPLLHLTNGPVSFNSSSMQPFLKPSAYHTVLLLLSHFQHILHTYWPTAHLTTYPPFLYLVNCNFYLLLEELLHNTLCSCFIYQACCGLYLPFMWCPTTTLKACFTGHDSYLHCCMCHLDTWLQSLPISWLISHQNFSSVWGVTLWHHTQVHAARNLTVVSLSCSGWYSGLCAHVTLCASHGTRGSDPLFAIIHFPATAVTADSNPAVERKWEKHNVLYV